MIVPKAELGKLRRCISLDISKGPDGQFAIDDDEHAPVWLRLHGPDGGFIRFASNWDRPWVRQMREAPIEGCRRQWLTEKDGSKSFFRIGERCPTLSKTTCTWPGRSWSRAG
jgi:hypothetical protein